MTINPGEHIRPYHSPAQKSQTQDYAAKVATLSDADFAEVASDTIWLSAYAQNNHRSAFHAMADIAYGEAQGRGKPELYDEAHRKASSR